jgi:hypothetical protein
MIQQKQAVINEVLRALPGFNLGCEDALTFLDRTKLEFIKAQIVMGIRDGSIAYSKDRTDLAETLSYGRSMVMNHLKKAKELNGGGPYTPTGPKAKAAPVSAIDYSIMPEELVQFVKNL